MTARKGLYLEFWLDGYKLTPLASEVTPSIEYETIEAGAYNNPVKQYLCGRGEGSIDFSGLFDSTTDGATHEALKQVGIDKVAGIAYGNNAAPAQGDIACGMPVHQASYNVSADLDGTIAAKAALKSVGTPLEWGVLLANLTAVSVDGNTASIDDGAASSAGASAYLFVSGVSAADTCLFKVQHSTNNSTWVDLITFTLDGSAIDAERLEVSGTVNRYVRVLYDVTGTAVDIDFAVIFCRK